MKLTILSYYFKILILLISLWNINLRKIKTKVSRKSTFEFGVLNKFIYSTHVGFIKSKVLSKKIFNFALDTGSPFISINDKDLTEEEKKLFSFYSEGTTHEMIKIRNKILRVLGPKEVKINILSGKFIAEMGGLKVDDSASTFSFANEINQTVNLENGEENPLNNNCKSGNIPLKEGTKEYLFDNTDIANKMVSNDKLDEEDIISKIRCFNFRYWRTVFIKSKDESHYYKLVCLLDTGSISDKGILVKKDLADQLDQLVSEGEIKNSNFYEYKQQLDGKLDEDYKNLCTITSTLTVKLGGFEVDESGNFKFYNGGEPVVLNDLIQ